MKPFQRMVIVAALAGCVWLAGCGDSADSAEAGGGRAGTLAEDDGDAGDGPVADTASVCADISSAIENTDVLFEAGDLPDMDAALAQTTEELLASAAAGLGDGAPQSAVQMLEASAEMAGALGDASTAEDPVGAFRGQAQGAQDVFEALDWDEVEDWFEAECGIEVIGIALRNRSDDRTAAATTSADE